MNASAEKENASIIRSCGKAADDLRRAWGKGDSRGRKQVEKWDQWFRDLAYKIVDVKNAGRLSPEAERAALDACRQILASKVPHWEHPDDIALIRATLAMDKVYDDYPIKSGIGFDDSDDDEY